MKKSFLLFALAFMSFTGMNAQCRMYSDDLPFDQADEYSDIQLFLDVDEQKYYSTDFTIVMPEGFSIMSEYDEVDEQYIYYCEVNKLKQGNASANVKYFEDTNSYHVITTSISATTIKTNNRYFFSATIVADPSVKSGSYTVTVKDIAIADDLVKVLLDDFTFDIIYTRPAQTFNLTVTSAGMATLFLDYPVSIPSGVYDTGGIYYVDGITGTTLTMTEIEDNIPANTGVIVMANQGTYTFTEVASDVPALTDNLLKGVLVATPTTDLSGNGIYTLGRGVNSGWLGFHKYTGSTLSANKAYMTKDGGSVNSFNLQFPDGTTAISSIEAIKGQTVYDLQGRKVENPERGVYIINGVKTIIK